MEESEEDGAHVPFCVSGGITIAHPSLCMDGATHLIHTTIIGTIRLVAINDEAQKALEKFQDAKIIVTVCGTPKRSVNCSHMEVYSVEKAADFAPKLLALGGSTDLGGG